MDKEIWVDIIGYEGKYKISNLGRVKSLNWRKQHKEGILKGIDDHKGYLKVNLRLDGKIHALHIHRLVARHFIENPNHYPIVNHKDENTLNNCADNLEWCTHIYNINYGTCKNKMSNAKIGKRLSDTTCRELSMLKSGKNHWHYGGCWSEETKEKISKTKIHNKFVSYTCDGLIFYSIPDVAKYLNRPYQTVYQWIKGRSQIPLEYKQRKLKIIRGDKID